jgi:predicted RNase H-like nuclease (RuvC/YqgF family)
VPSKRTLPWLRKTFAGSMKRFVPSKTDVRAIGVVVERVESKLVALAEGVMSFRDGVRAEMADLEQRLSARISALEEAVRKNSEDLRTLRVEVAELRLRFDQRELRLEDLERRVSEVEKRVSGVG